MSRAAIAGAWLAVLVPATSARARASSQEQPGAASSSEVEALITRGRSLLEQQRAQDAEQLFVDAWSLSGGDPRARVWIWRAWLQTGRVNDALDEVDRAEQQGLLPPADIDYMRGMAFFFLGRAYIEEQVGEPFTSEAFRDATRWLAAATASPQGAWRYHDAWLALAESAWHVHEYAIGREAARRAIAHRPTDPRGALLLARLLFQRYLHLRGQTPTLPDTPEGWAQEARAVWDELVGTLRSLLEELQSGADGPLGAERRTFAADAWLQLGYAYEQEGRLEEAREAFASSAALWPSGLDYADLRGRFAPQEFRALLEGAAARAAERFADEDPDDALLRWWLGWARHASGDWRPAAEAFTSAAGKWPAYVDARVWAARSWRAAGEPERAVEALLAGWRSEPSVVSDTLLEGGAEDEALVAELVRWCEGAGLGEQREALLAVSRGTWPRLGGR